MNRQVTFPLNGIRKDNFGNWEPLLVDDELVTISTDDYSARLDERPSDGLVAPSTAPPKIYASDGTGGYTVELTRTTSPVPSADEFYVNYTTATLSFNSTRAGEVVRAVYYKIGSIVSATEINVIADRLTSNGGPPTVTDDEYNIGSIWYDYVNDQMYMCMDNTDDSALWSKSGTAVMHTDSSGRETGIDILSNGNMQFWNLGVLTATMDCTNHFYIHEFTEAGYVKNYANGRLYSGPISFSDMNIFAVDPIYMTTDSSGNYVRHRATSGSIHIPSDGTTGDALQWYADGTSQWVHPSTDVNLLPNSWNVISSQRAIKTYVDSQIAGVNFWVRNVIGSYELTPRDMTDRVNVGQFRISTFTTEGIVKNTTIGDISGGNTINVNDFETGFILPTHKGGTSLSSPPRYGDTIIGNSFGKFDLVNLNGLVQSLIETYGNWSSDAAVVGTENQINVINSDATVWTLSTPQDIHVGASPTFANMTITTQLTVGGGYGSTGATISTAGVGQFNGALTTDGALTALSAVIGGGYGSTGATISSAGVGQFNGALTTDGALTADSAIIGGGYGSTGTTISTTGAISANGAILTSSSLTAASAVIGGGYGSTGATISSEGIGQFNGALTTDGILTAAGAHFGGGYGDTGASIAINGDISMNGILNVDGEIKAIGIHNTGGVGATGAISSGTWTPDKVAYANIDAITAYAGYWLRVGQIVTFGVQFSVDASSDSMVTTFSFSLPVLTNITSVNDLTGSSNILDDTTVHNRAAGIAYALTTLGGVAWGRASFVSVFTGVHMVHVHGIYIVK